ncbi:hypothetical protein BpHYR1_045570 [Brachionus plicatilis]|uniref:Uncharacterized protein n=1 Tax=Brachionus plicatilis TaxID=10195 RepID=A0A3M7QN83_BRAPC|nr:hypothetical protein BpHYR1_045570 [Brachionus plicatilis]
MASFSLLSFETFVFSLLMFSFIMHGLMTLSHSRAYIKTKNVEQNVKKYVIVFMSIYTINLKKPEKNLNFFNFRGLLRLMVLKRMIAIMMFWFFVFNYCFCFNLTFFLKPPKKGSIAICDQLFIKICDQSKLHRKSVI